MSGQKKQSSQAGFTLLETIIAITIMIIAFSAILMVESASINTSAKAKQMNIVSMLAKRMMIESEYKFEGKPFDEVKKEEGGAFEAPYEDYSWKRSIKEIKFPSLQSSGGDDENKDQGGSPDAAAETITKLVTKFLSKSMREVTVTISWKKGTGEQSFSVSTYWVDLNHEFELQE